MFVELIKQKQQAIMASFSLFSSGKHRSFKSLSPSKFRELINENTVQLIDVRTPEEYQQKKIEGATLINLYNPDFETIIDTTLDIDIPVAVYCHSGIRSVTAARIMAKKGFTVYNLESGLLFW